MLLSADSVTRSEIDKKDKQVEEITKRYTSEREVRLKTEQERENLATELVYNSMQFLCFLYRNA